MAAALIASCGGSTDDDIETAGDVARQVEPTDVPSTTVPEPTATVATPTPQPTATPVPPATATPVPTAVPTPTSVPAPAITLPADLFVFDRTEPSQAFPDWTGHYYVYQGETDEQRTVYVEERPYFGLNLTAQESTPFDELAQRLYDLEGLDSFRQDAVLSELMPRPWGYRFDTEYHISDADSPRYRYSHLLIEESRSSFTIGVPPSWDVGNTFVEWVDQYFATAPPPSSLDAG